MNRKKLIRLLALCAAVSTNVAYAQTSVTPKVLIKPSVMPFPFVLGGRSAGEVPLQVAFDAKGGHYSVRPADLAPVLKDKLSPQALAALEAGTAFVPIEQFPSDTIELSFDNARQELAGDLRADKTSVRSLSLSGERPARPNAEYAEPAMASGYLNIRPYMEYYHKGAPNGRGRQPVSVAVDGASRLLGDSGVAFEGSGAYSEGGSTSKFSRNDLRFVYDRPQSLLRAQVGDLNYNSTGFQSQPRMGGISLASRFDLQPEKVFRPTGGRTIQVDRASDAEIYVNGSRVRTISLDAGQYNLSDFPYTVGNNNVEIVLRDKAGREQRISFSGYQDFSLLANGVQEYSYNLGALSSLNDNGGYDYAMGKPVFSGFHRYGLSDSVTAGLNAQSTKDVHLGGAGINVGTRFGIVGADVAASHSDVHGKGYAGTLRYRADTAVRNQSRDTAFNSFAFQADTSYYNSNFVTIDDTLSSLKTASNVSVSTDLSPRLSSYLSGQYDQVRAGTAGVLSGTGAQAGYRMGGSVGFIWSVTDRISTNIQTRYKRDTSIISGDQDDITTFLSASWRPFISDTIVTTYDTGSKQGTADYYHSADNATGALSYNIGATYQDSASDNAGIRGGASYYANRAILEAATDSSLQMGNSSTADTWRSSVRLNTALVFADGHVAVSRPVSDSFAMVVPDKSLGGAKLRVDPQRDGNARAETDMFGPAVVTDIFSYYPSNLPVEADKLPVGYDVGKGSFDVLPAYHSGYVLPFGSSYSVTVLGTVDPALVKKLALTAARIENASDPKFKPVTTFTNSEGKFASGGLKAGTYTLRFISNPEYVGTFTVPDNNQALVRLDNIKLTPKD